MRRAAAVWLAAALACGPASAETADPSAWRRSPGSGEPAASLGRELSRGLLSYERLRDYEALFLKREWDAQGMPGEEEEIFFKFEKPWKVFLGWQSSRKKGLQVVYERGRHDNKLAVHQPGLLFGLMPVVFLEQSSPYVREGSESFDIEDAGIGTFLHDFTRAVDDAHAKGRLEVLAGPDGRTYEVGFPGSEPDEVYFARRVLVRFDETTGLPVFFELHDWQGRPIGRYEYRDLRLDVGPDSPAFGRAINRYLARVYRGD